MAIKSGDCRNIEMGDVMEEVASNIMRLWKRANERFEPPVVIQLKAIKSRLLTAWGRVSDISR